MDEEEEEPKQKTEGMLRFTLRKRTELVTAEEFERFKKVAVLGVDLNDSISYALLAWDLSKGDVELVRAGCTGRPRSSGRAELSSRELVDAALKAKGELACDASVIAFEGVKDSRSSQGLRQ